MRSTREIETPYGRMLFSPVHARTLEGGDLVLSSGAGNWATPATVSTVLPNAGDAALVDVHYVRGRGPGIPSTLDRNAVMLRATGSRSGGMPQ